MRGILIAGLCAVFIMASCTGRKDTSVQGCADVAVRKPVALTDITGQWYIEKIVFNGSDSVRPCDEVPGVYQYVVFSDSTYSIITNCNALSGSYSVKGDSVVIRSFMMTELCCDNMATENALRRIFPNTFTVDVENDSVVRLNSVKPLGYIVLRKAGVETK